VGILALRLILRWHTEGNPLNKGVLFFISGGST
jgi:hypothetical protein